MATKLAVVVAGMVGAAESGTVVAASAAEGGTVAAVVAAGTVVDAGVVGAAAGTAVVARQPGRRTS